MLSKYRRPEPGFVAEAVACCPFRDLAAGVCRASFSALPLTQLRQSYCTSEDHDDCALFLARLLRASRPLTFDRQNREFCLK